MGQDHAQEKAALIERIAEFARQRLGGAQAAQAERFVRYYYEASNADDLLALPPDDLYGAALSHWKLAQLRRPGEVLLHVYNPRYDEHGWQSTHTDIEVVMDDMPYLVDSISMELLRELPVAQRRAIQIIGRKRQQIVGNARLVVIADEAFGLRRLRTAEALACELCDALDERGLFLRMILTHVDSLLGDVHPLPPIPNASDLKHTIVIAAANIKAARHRGAISAKMCASPHAAASGQ